MLACSSTLAREDWTAQVDLRRFDALLFDLDGTLVETMTLHGRAYSIAFGMLGYHLRLEDYLSRVGPPAGVAIAALAAAAGMGEIDDATVRAIHAEKKKRFLQLLAESPPRALDAATLLTRPRQGRRVGLVSSGNRGGVEAILRRMGWLHLFDVVVTGDDVREGKPSAAPYLQAAAALGVSPSRCLAFEDAEAGIRAALAAGMSVVDVTRAGAKEIAASRGGRRSGG